jgi:hypothetical protein
MNKNLYLEISPRMTGKSDRLLLAVMQHINEGGTAVVYTPSLALGKSLYNKVLPSYQIPSRLYFVGNGGDYLRALNLSDPKTRLFYDEFDHLDPEKVYWSTDGYYVTTPAKIRKDIDVENVDHEGMSDPLISLLVKNDFVYHTVERDFDRDTRKGFYGSIYSNDKEGIINKALEEEGLIFESSELLAKLGQAQTREAYANLASKNSESSEYYDEDCYDDGGGYDSD